MKNTSACYLSAGLIAGVALSKASAAEPAWLLLLVAAGLSAVVGLIVDHA